MKETEFIKAVSISKYNKFELNKNSELILIVTTPSINSKLYSVCESYRDYSSINEIRVKISTKKAEDKGILEKLFKDIREQVRTINTHNLEPIFNKECSHSGSYKELSKGTGKTVTICSYCDNLRESEMYEYKPLNIYGELLKGSIGFECMRKIHIPFTDNIISKSNIVISYH